MMPRPGTYRHFKGGMYRVLCVPLDVERSDEAGEPELGVTYIDTNLNYYYCTYSRFTDEICRSSDCPNLGKEMTRKCTVNSCTLVPRFELVEAE